MRSPRGPGVSRFGATIIATVLGLTALAAAPVMGAHHLEGEAAAPKATKIMVIAPDEFTSLVGAKRTFWASICNEDGSGCKDAKKAKWSVVPKKGLKLSKKKGVQIAAQGVKAGSYELRARQNGVSGTVTVKINEPPKRDVTAPTTDELRLYITPEEVTLGPGELAILSAWGCPLGANGRTGENGVADGIDDDCLPQYIEEVRLDKDSGATLLGPMGSLFGIRMDELDGTEATALYGLVSVARRTAQDTEPADAGPRFIGAQVVTGIGATLPSIVGDPAKSAEADDVVDFAFQDVLEQLEDGYADGATAGVLANLLFGEGGEPASGDIDGDGLVDQRDLFVAEAILDINTDGPGQDDPVHNRAADMDGDGKITAADVGIIRGLWQRGVQEGLQGAAAGS